MTATLTVLYTVPDDPDEFDQHYQDVHVPIIKRFEGVQDITMTRVSATFGGEARYHLVTQVSFPDRGTLDAALGSEAGRESGKDFGEIAPPGSFMIIGEAD